MAQFSTRQFHILSTFVFARVIFQWYFMSTEAIFYERTLHRGFEYGRKYWTTCLSVRSPRSLICLLCTASFTRALHYAHSFAGLRASLRSPISPKLKNFLRFRFSMIFTDFHHSPGRLISSRCHIENCNN